jgi:hypothetical protein
MRLMRKLGWVFAALTIVVALVRIGVVLADRGGVASVGSMREPEPYLSDSLAELVMISVFAGIGSFLTMRVPRNAIGWLLITTGFGFSVLLLAERLGWHFLVAGSGAAPFLFWVADWFWLCAVVPLFIGVPLLFPSGRPASARWRRLLYLALANVALFVILTTLTAGPLEQYPVAENPFGVARVFADVRDIAFAGVIASALISIASLFLRFRSAEGVEREQIKWMWVAVAVLVAGLATQSSLEDSHPSLAGALFIVSIMSIPVAVAVAILRYRLYDVNVVVNRTLVYGGLTASLAAVYLGGVLLFGLLLAPITSDSGLAVAISTLAVAALFRPVRARIQALVDRRFYRRRYDAAVTLDAFNARLRDEIDLDSLVRELGGVVEQTVQPSHVSLWLRPTGQ